MNTSLKVCSALAIATMVTGTAGANTLFSDGFETGWGGDYAPGWVNAAYRHGPAPVGKMMQQSTMARSGTYGLKLIADSTPQSWMWWASVEVESLSASALAKQYDPWVSAWYYDEGTTAQTPPGRNKAGQVYAVPSWVNPYIPSDPPGGPGEDWTDVQYGARFNTRDNYYYVAAGENSPGWRSTGEAREAGWHQLKFQLSSADGRMHFFLDGAEVGQSYRNDYADLGTAIGLYTMFENPLSAWGEDKPFTLWDDFAVGSSVPDGGLTAMLLGMGVLALGYVRRMVK